MRYLLVSALCLSFAPAAFALAQSEPKIAAPAGLITPQEATTCVLQTIACEQTIQGSLDPGDCKLADGTAYDDFQFSGTNGETVTATGSRWVTTYVESGKTAESGPNCSRCWGDFRTHRVGPRRNVTTWSTFFMYA